MAPPAGLPASGKNPTAAAATTASAETRVPVAADPAAALLLSGIPQVPKPDPSGLAFCAQEQAALAQQLRGLKTQLEKLPPGQMHWNDAESDSDFRDTGPDDGGTFAESPVPHTDALAELIKTAAHCQPAAVGAWAVRPGSLVRTYSGDLQLAWSIVYAPPRGSQLIATGDPPQDAGGRALGPLAVPAFVARIDDPFYIPSRKLDDGELHLPVALATYDFDGDGASEALVVERHVSHRVSNDKSAGPTLQEEQSTYVSIWTVKQGAILPYAARWHRVAARIMDADRDGRPDLILEESPSAPPPATIARSHSDGSFVIEPGPKQRLSAGLCSRAQARTQVALSAIARMLDQYNQTPKPSEGIIPRASIQALEKLLAGGCESGSQDAWALVLQDTHLDNHGPGRLSPDNANADFALVYLAADGSVAARSEPVKASFCCSQWYRAYGDSYCSDSFPAGVQIADYNRDGRSEAILKLAYRQREEEPEGVNDKDTLTLWTTAAGQVQPMKVPGLASFEEAKDVDGDGLPDLVYYPYSSDFFSGCGIGFSYIVRGPALLVHATGDPQQPFNKGDEAALRFARQSCPRPKPPYIDGTGRPGSASFQWSANNTAHKIACARMWGVTSRVILQQIRRMCPHPDPPADSSCESCENSEDVQEWAVKDPPLLLTGTGPSK